jgi:multiple sugar transport system permease protein
MTMSSRRWSRQLVLYVLLALILLWTLVPIFWMMLSSFKSPDDILSTTPKVIFEPTLQHYQGLFVGGNSLGGYVKNSLLAAGISTIISVALACLAGYGLARSHFRGKQHLSFWIISTRMAPIAAVIVPLYLIFRNLDLLDSVIGLIIAYLTFNLPFAILTTAVLCLIFAWNDYAFARTFSGPESQTIPIAAAQLITQTGIDWGKLTAIGTVVVLPMVIVGLAVRRWLVRGLTLGAVKGE